MLTTCGTPEESSGCPNPVPSALRLINVHAGCLACIVQEYDLVAGTLADVCNGARHRHPIAPFHCGVEGVSRQRLP